MPTPRRSAQCASWSAAAARNVSAATSNTSRSASTACAASLAAVVVLPTPLTPTSSQTFGCPGTRWRLRSTPRSRVAAISRSSTPGSSPASRTPSSAARSRTRSTSPVVVGTPTSARSSVSSISSHASSSSFERARSRPAMPENGARERPRRSRKRGFVRGASSGAGTSSGTSPRVACARDDRACGAVR